MMSTETAAVNAAVHPPPVPSQKPRVPDGQGDDDGDEDAGDPVGEALHLGLAVLRVLDEPGHLGELGVAADAGRADDEAAAGVDGGTDDGVADTDLDRDGLAGEHRGVERRGALGDDAVGGDLLAGADDELVADDELLDGDALLAAAAQDGDVLGAHLEQGAQGGAGAPLRPGLGVAPGEQERRHPGRGLEVDVAGRRRCARW